MKENILFENKSILITGGTGSLGKEFLKTILNFKFGIPKKIVIFSRDEAKQYLLKSELNKYFTSENDLYDINSILKFIVGDIRNYHDVKNALNDINIVFNTAALKQVPTCEYFPFQAIETNIIGAENIVRTINEHNINVDTVIGLSTDKACKPINVMGMTKSLQERIFTNANILCKNTRFLCVRYGNVLLSRGSAIPLFLDQINNNNNITVTLKDMTRFLLGLDDAVKVVIDAYNNANNGEIYVPKLRSAKIIDIINILLKNKNVKKDIVEIGIRPGEKIHEILVSEEESFRTIEKDGYFIIKPALPELIKENYLKEIKCIKEYSSKDNIMSIEDIENMLKRYNII